MDKFIDDTITLCEKEIPVKVGFLPVAELLFYPENPRIYSIICNDEKEPSQKDIFDQLNSKDYVRELIQSIKLNGGLREPLIVRNKMVLEGNNRLAAYINLMQKDPIKWGMVKCKVLDERVTDDIVFAILADHINGKKDWVPYEQAGYMYRRHKQHNISIDKISRELAMKPRRINFYIEVYQFMIDKGEKKTDRWSYFFEYLKCNITKKARKNYPQLDDLIVNKIKLHEIPTAEDLRDKLKIILKAKTNTISKFISKEFDFEEAYDASCNQGHDNSLFSKLQRFRLWIVNEKFDEIFKESNKDIKNKCKFELTRISKKISKIIKSI